MLTPFYHPLPFEIRTMGQLDKMMVESRMIQQQITDLQQKADRAVSEIHELSNQIAQLEVWHRWGVCP